jgi:hypothetical protein
MTITQVLSSVMQDVTSIGKTDKNDFHKFMFRGIDSVLNAVGPVLRKHGVVVVPELRDLVSRDVLTSKEKSTREVTVTVAYTFHGPDGDQLVCVVPGEAQDSGDKAVSKAMSVAFRTALIQTLSIPTEDRDPDSASYERGRPDLLTGWKNKIMEEAKKREWDVERLAYEYSEWSEGGDIREATADMLQQYYAVLVPPKKVQRAPLQAAPEAG